MQFVFIYLQEAHPKDGWSFGDKFSPVNSHKTIEDRIDAARMLVDIQPDLFTSEVDDNDDKVRVLVDNIDNTFALNYAAWPTRILVVENNEVSFISEHPSEVMQHPEFIMSDGIKQFIDKRFPDEE